MYGKSYRTGVIKESITVGLRSHSQKDYDSWNVKEL